MIVFPNAKINLGLHITGQRPDGFHSVETVLLPVGLSDALEVVQSGGQHDLYSYSGIHMPDNGKPNLCQQALEAFRKKHGHPAFPPLEVHLHKHIPVGAGLGGGSADASFMLRLLNDWFEYGVKEKELANTASSLGSDCPFFIYNRPALATGRGDKLQAIDRDVAAGLHLAIVVPSIHIPTAEAYAGVVPRTTGKNIPDILSCDPETWKTQLLNDFEPGIFARHPEIKTIKERLYELGAVYASMSGSGSGVFGLFRRLPETDVKKAFHGSFVWTEAIPATS